MAFKFKRDHESMEDIAKEYESNRGARWFPPGFTPTSRAFREDKVMERQEELDRLEFEQQTQPCFMNLNVDLRNKYQVKAAIKTLQSTLDELEKEDFNVPG